MHNKFELPWLEVNKAIAQRKKEVKLAIAESGYQFENKNALSNVVIDAFHGEMHYGQDIHAVTALNKAWTDIISEGQEKYFRHNKKQPEDLQLVANSHLFDRLQNPEIEGVRGLNIPHKDIVVVPYSSTQLTINALLRRPKKNCDIALCPEGFYKGNAELAASAGLRIKTFPVSFDNDGCIIPEILDEYLTYYQPELAVLWLTMPGNPLIAQHSKVQLEQIARIVVKHNVDIFIDMLFDKMVPKGEYISFSNIQITDEQGNIHRIYDKTLIVAGNSKGFNATGPWKMGAAISGNTLWLAETREQSTAVTFQRETTHLIYAATANTTEEYILKNQKDMINRQQITDKIIATINERFEEEVLISYGKPKYGPFRGIRFCYELLEKAGIEDSWQLADFMLASAGIETVDFTTIGTNKLGIRINVACPRIGGDKNPDNLLQLFNRLAYLIDEIKMGLTYDKGLKRIGINEKVNINSYKL